MEFLNYVIDKALSRLQQIKIIHFDKHFLFFNWHTIYRLFSFCKVIGCRSSQTFLIFHDVIICTFVTLLDVSTEIDSERNCGVFTQILR